jgi:hypothetical protein
MAEEKCNVPCFTMRKDFKDGGGFYSGLCFHIGEGLRMTVVLHGCEENQEIVIS